MSPLSTLESRLPSTEMLKTASSSSPRYSTAKAAAAPRPSEGVVPGKAHASERLSAATLRSLRTTVLKGAATAAVSEVYAFGSTIGTGMLSLWNNWRRELRDAAHVRPRYCSGTGGYAIVKVATHLRSGQEVAVKIMRLPAADAEPLPVDAAAAGSSLPGRVSLEEDVLKEIEILKCLNQCAHLA